MELKNDQLYVIIAGVNGDQWIKGVTHSARYADRQMRRSKYPTHYKMLSCKLPRYTNGKIKDTFKVWLQLDSNGKPNAVSFEPLHPEVKNFKVFDSMNRENAVNKTYHRWYILLDEHNYTGEEGLSERDCYDRREATERLKKSPNNGELVFITRRRRYSDNLPYRLEISISTGIGTHRTREDIAREIDDAVFRGRINVNELEYNVDYSLTPSRWEITPDLLRRDEEIKVK